MCIYVDTLFVCTFCVTNMCEAVHPVSAEDGMATVGGIPAVLSIGMTD